MRLRINTLAVSVINLGLCFNTFAGATNFEQYLGTQNLKDAILVSRHERLLTTPNQNAIDAWFCFDNFPQTARVKCQDSEVDDDGIQRAYFILAFSVKNISYNIPGRRSPYMASCMEWRKDINAMFSTSDKVCIRVEIPGATVEILRGKTKITASLRAVQTDNAYWEGYP